MSENRLLILDDMLEFANIVSTVATSLEYSCKSLDDSTSFWQFVELFNPSLVMMDLGMPKVDGVEILREMGARRFPTDIILASGADPRTLKSARRLAQDLGLSIVATISKPVSVSEIQALLNDRKNVQSEIDKEAIQQAIEQDQLFLCYQPKIDLETGRVSGVEALVRWRTETGEVVYPDAFIDIVENEGLAASLFGWVFENGVRQAGQWHQEGLPLKLSVNLSAHNVLDRHGPETVSRICNEAGLPTNNVILELTETASMRDATTMMEVLTRYRLHGFMLSIDDFGTGYSSLTQLVRLPFSEIKIDKSFVMDMETEADSGIVAKTITTMGHNLGLQVVAEGIESQEACSHLKEWGCDIGQGYLFSKPIQAQELAEFAAHHGVATASQM